MTPDPCLVCTALDRRPVRTPRAGYTCDHCLRRMREQLTSLVDLYALAGDELTLGRSVGGRSSEPSIGLRVAALDLRNGVDPIGILTSWCKAFREDFGFTDWVEVREYHVRDRTQVTLVEVVAYLGKHLARISESHPAVDEFAKELAFVHVQAMSAANAWPRPGWVVSCPADKGEGPCGRTIRVTGEQFGEEVLCPGCGTTWDVTRLLLVAASDAGSSLWLPAAEVRLLYGVAESTLKRWAKDGIVERDHGRYRAESVRAAMLRPDTRKRLRMLDADAL